jgi:Cys-tRNA synthase (O-phospho-L-seryl-tRNA:Cys-tRNA synthase)
MVDVFRKKRATAAMLEALEMADGYPLAEDVLRGYLKDMVKPPIKDAEWKEITQEALAHDLMVRVPSKLDDDLVQFAITERGQALRRN